jgi:hypothetical protein
MSYCRKGERAIISVALAWRVNVALSHRISKLS